MSRCYEHLTVLKNVKNNYNGHWFEINRHNQAFKLLHIDVFEVNTNEVQGVL